MSIFVITATRTTDDYKRPYTYSETEVATSHSDAVIRAVEFYLESLEGGSFFDWYNPSGFNEIIEEHRNNPQTLFSALYSYFKTDPEGMFIGDYVPATLSVTIREQEHIPLDTKPILSTIDEITHYIKEKKQKT